MWVSGFRVSGFRVRVRVGLSARIRDRVGMPVQENGSG